MMGPHDFEDPEEKAIYFYRKIIPRLQRQDNLECHLCLAIEWNIPGVPLEKFRHSGLCALNLGDD